MAKYHSFYSQYFPGLKNRDGEVQTSCCFHGEDAHPSMSINLRTGVWNCFTCDEGGDAIHFYRKKHNCSFAAATRALREAGITDGIIGDVPDKPQPVRINVRTEKEYRQLEAEVKEWHSNLMNSTKLKKRLSSERGITEATIKQFELGHDLSRFTIPIRDKQGRIVNVRRYDPDAKGNVNKMLSYKKGWGAARLFPIMELIKHDEILLCEGEMDAILATQMGFHAISVTGGAGTWKEEWNELFSNKTVWISYDVDKAGEKGAQKVAHNIFRVAQTTKIINLPLDAKGSDITDYFIGHGIGAADLKGLIARTRAYEPTQEEKDKDAPITVHLSSASKGEHRGKMLKMNVIVAGKEEMPFSIPETIKYSCDTPADDKCQLCTCHADGEVKLTLTAQDTCLLKMIDVPTSTMWTAIEGRAGIYPKCSNVGREILSHFNVESIHLIPEIDQGETEEIYLIANAYYVGHGIVANQSYNITALATAEPKTQRATLLIETADPAQDSVTSFEMTPELLEELKIFQCGDGDEEIEAKLTEIHNDLADNVTSIYGRNDLLTGIDLVMHSVLSFEFQGKQLDRGWAECLILGDTRTGKTETVKSLMRHYKAGSFTTGESASRAGLVGGAQQVNSRWLITWGKIPLNDRKLVAIDEVTGLTQDEIGQMSGIRSSGVAEITKIVTSKTHSRTRLIWISNPRDAKNLGDYSYGCNAIGGIIGKPEDVARFDFALTCASDEVGTDVINDAKDVRVPHIYTSDLCHKLVLWAWSRRPEQVEFKPKAMKAILEYAKLMGKDFSSSIPLVEAADQRIKIARLSVAMAARVFSTDKTGQKIVVKKSHVSKVVDYLYEIYNKGSLGYKHYSWVKQRNARRVEDNIIAINEFLAPLDDLRDFCLGVTNVRVTTMAVFLNEDKQICQAHVSFMLRKGLLTEGNNSAYVKTAEFIKLLRAGI